MGRRLPTAWTSLPNVWIVEQPPESEVYSNGLRIDNPVCGLQIREKLLNFADAAEQRPEFALELPRFLAEVWRIFNQYEIAGYVASLKPKQRKRLRTLLYLHCATPGPAAARVGSEDGLTALGQE